MQVRKAALVGGGRPFAVAVARHHELADDLRRGQVADQALGAGVAPFVSRRAMAAGEVIQIDHDSGTLEEQLDNLAMDASAKVTMEEWLAAGGQTATPKSQTDPEQAFLVNYVLNRGWLSRSEKDLTAPDADVDLSEDEEHVVAWLNHRYYHFK